MTVTPEWGFPAPTPDTATHVVFATHRWEDAAHPLLAALYARHLRVRVGSRALIVIEVRFAPPPALPEGKRGPSRPFRGEEPTLLLSQRGRALPPALPLSSHLREDNVMSTACETHVGVGDGVCGRPRLRVVRRQLGLSLDKT